MTINMKKHIISLFYLLVFIFNIYFLSAVIPFRFIISKPILNFSLQKKDKFIEDFISTNMSSNTNADNKDVVVKVLLGSSQVDISPLFSREDIDRAINALKEGDNYAWVSSSIWQKKLIYVNSKMFYGSVDSIQKIVISSIQSGSLVHKNYNVSSTEKIYYSDAIKKLSTRIDDTNPTVLLIIRKDNNLENSPDYYLLTLAKERE